MQESKPRKRFGQNFLHDPGVIRRIFDTVNPQPTDHFVEIGPGRGALTHQLATSVGQLDVIEIDRDLARDIEAQGWADEITVHTADALQFDFTAIGHGAATKSLRLIGNLPYNISTPLLFHVLSQVDLFVDIHVMLQKEVVRRMAAAPGSREYGRLTVALAAHCEVESLFQIGPGAFNPAPKVDSAFAKLTPLREPLLTSSEQPVFDQILRSAFGQRRKQLGNSLSSVVSIDTIRAAGIDPELRAENLGVGQYVELTRQHLDNNH